MKILRQKKGMFHPIIWVIVALGLIASIIEIGWFMGWITPWR